MTCYSNPTATPTAWATPVRADANSNIISGRAASWFSPGVCFGLLTPCLVRLLVLDELAVFDALGMRP